MAEEKTTFALFFGNRGFFPASIIAQAREELPRLLKEWGHDSLILDAEATRHGAEAGARRGPGSRGANGLTRLHRQNLTAILSRCLGGEMGIVQTTS